MLSKKLQLQAGFLCPLLPSGFTTYSRCNKELTGLVLLADVCVRFRSANTALPTWTVWEMIKSNGHGAKPISRWLITVDGLGCERHGLRYTIQCAGTSTPYETITPSLTLCSDAIQPSSWLAFPRLPVSHSARGPGVDLVLVSLQPLPSLWYVQTDERSAGTPDAQVCSPTEKGEASC